MAYPGTMPLPRQYPPIVSVLEPSNVSGFSREPREFVELSNKELGEHWPWGPTIDGPSYTFLFAMHLLAIVHSRVDYVTKRMARFPICSNQIVRFEKD